MSSGHKGIAETASRAKKMKDEIAELQTQVAELQGWIKNFNVQALGQFIEQTNSGLHRNTAIIDGLVHLASTDTEAGVDRVQAAVYVVQEQAVENRFNGEKAKLDQALAEGYVTVDTTIKEASILLAKEYSKEGRQVEGKSWAFTSLPPDFKKTLHGEPVGVNVPTPNGGKFEVCAIYLVDEEKAKELVAAQQAGMQAQQQANAATTNAPAAP
jgi:hypothetical protein